MQCKDMVSGQNVSVSNISLSLLNFILFHSLANLIKRRLYIFKRYLKDYHRIEDLLVPSLEAHIGLKWQRRGRLYTQQK